MPTLESLRQRMTPFLFLNHFSRVLANSWFNVHLGYGGARTSMTSFFRGAADSQSLVKFACSKLQMSNHLGGSGYAPLLDLHRFFGAGIVFCALELPSSYGY